MTRLTRWLASACLLSLILLTSCTGVRGADISGSLQSFYEIEYSTIRARLYQSELAIEYVKEDGTVPVRVTIQRDQTLAPGAEYDLQTQGAITGRSKDTDMPPLNNGAVTLRDFDVAPGSRIRGDFDASFQVGDASAGLSGSFDTTLEVVEFVEGYDHDFGKPDMGETDMDEDMPSGE